MSNWKLTLPLNNILIKQWEESMEPTIIAPGLSIRLIIKPETPNAWINPY